MRPAPGRQGRVGSPPLPASARLCPPGRNFDENGNMLDWWSNFSAQHFREQSECMIHQYGNYSWDLAGHQNVRASCRPCRRRQGPPSPSPARGEPGRRPSCPVCR